MDNVNNAKNKMLRYEIFEQGNANNTRQNNHTVSFEIYAETFEDRKEFLCFIYLLSYYWKIYYKQREKMILYSWKHKRGSCSVILLLKIMLNKVVLIFMADGECKASTLLS